MVGAIALEKTDRVGGTAPKAAAGDLRAKASVPHLTDGGYVRTVEYMGALEFLHLADAPTHDKARKELVHE